MQTEAPAIEQGGIKEFQKRPDIFRAFCWLASAAAVAILAWIIFEIGRQALPAVQKFGLEFSDELEMGAKSRNFRRCPVSDRHGGEFIDCLDFRPPLGSWRLRFSSARISFLCRFASSSALRWRCWRRFRA